MTEVSDRKVDWEVNIARHGFANCFLNFQQSYVWALDGLGIFRSHNDRSALKGGGKKDWRRVSAFSVARQAIPPSGLLSAGVHVSITLCLFLPT